MWHTPAMGRDPRCRCANACHGPGLGAGGGDISGPFQLHIDVAHTPPWAETPAAIVPVHVTALALGQAGRYAGGGGGFQLHTEVGVAMVGTQTSLLKLRSIDRPEITRGIWGPRLLLCV